jgi:hypothetical protein
MFIARMENVIMPSNTPWIKEYLDMLHNLMNTDMNEPEQFSL